MIPRAFGVCFACAARSTGNSLVLRHRCNRATPSALSSHCQRSIASANYPRLSQPGKVPSACIRNYAGPFSRADYTRSRGFPRKGHAIHQGRLLLPLEKQARCVGTQLQRKSDLVTREILELCTVYRGESCAAGTCDSTGGLSFQFRCLRFTGPYACPPALTLNPGLKASLSMSLIQGPEGPCSLQVSSLTCQSRQSLR